MDHLHIDTNLLTFYFCPQRGQGFAIHDAIVQKRNTSSLVYFFAGRGEGLWFILFFFFAFIQQEITGRAFFFSTWDGFCKGT
jgi:hypothetical protein